MEEADGAGELGPVSVLAGPPLRRQPTKGTLDLLPELGT